MCNKDELRSQTQRLPSYLCGMMRSSYLYDILKKAKLGTENRSVVARGGAEGGDWLKRALGNFGGRGRGREGHGLVLYHDLGGCYMAVYIVNSHEFTRKWCLNKLDLNTNNHKRSLVKVKINKRRPEVHGHIGYDQIPFIHSYQWIYDR